MMARYRTDGDWTPRATAKVGEEGVLVRRVICESATAHDTQAGYRYPEGTYRVRVTGPKPAPVRTKRWTGELAWAHADSYFRDAIRAVEKEVRAAQGADW